MSTDNQDTNVPETVEEATPEQQLAAAVAERDQARAEVAELQDRLLRSRAEFENFRRRTDRDRSDFLQYAGMEVVRELLPILDDFERAMKTECAGAGYQKGIELIYQRLVETLKKIGIEPVDVPPGTPFDPNLHQAVVRAESEEAADNTVLDVFQQGYNFKGKLLRPSMVKVAVKAAVKPES